MRIAAAEDRVAAVATSIANYGSKRHIFERVAGPKEMWVVEDGFHPLRNLEHFGTLEPGAHLADWLRAAFDGRVPRSPARKVLVQAKGDGPYGDPVRGFFLPERDEFIPR